MLSGRKIIFVHVLVWSCFLFFSGFQFYNDFNEIPSRLYGRALLYIAIFYVNYLLLVPRFLLKNKLWSYFAGAIVLLTINGFVNESLEPNFKEFNNFKEEHLKIDDANLFEGEKLDSPKDFPKMGHKPGDKPFMIKYIVPSILPLLLIVLGAVIKMYAEWQLTEATKKEIAVKKVSSELQFLKAQLNPHFLFNSLNTVYALAVKKASETPEAVINLSEMMRYMLYEADKDSVALEKELEYLQHYIYLQRLRLKDSEAVTFNVHGDYKHKKIQPLLFVSFIENAFKYGTDFTGKTMVKIVIDIQDEGLSFFCENNVGHRKVDRENSGIGLENTKSRLQLLYPNRHQLSITANNELYTVNLHLKFNS